MPAPGSGSLGLVNWSLQERDLCRGGLSAIRHPTSGLVGIIVSSLARREMPGTGKDHQQLPRRTLSRQIAPKSPNLCQWLIITQESSVLPLIFTVHCKKIAPRLIHSGSAAGCRISLTPDLRIQPLPAALPAATCTVGSFSGSSSIMLASLQACQRPTVNLLATNLVPFKF